jgi:hypothetical protein
MRTHRIPKGKIEICMLDHERQLGAADDDSLDLFLFHIANYVEKSSF